MPLITLTQVADLLEYTGPNREDNARRTLNRWEVPAATREPGKGGRNLYDQALVVAAIERAPRPKRSNRQH